MQRSKVIPFHQLLQEHLANGTRPGGSPSESGRPWTNVEFGDAVGVSDRTVRYWRQGRMRPDDILSILRELFSDNPAYDNQRQEVKLAFGRPKPKGAEFQRRPRNKFPIARPARCFGRGQQVKTIVSQLSAKAQSSILVLGPPGIGKSTIIRQVVTTPKVAAKFGHRRWIITLETIHGSDSLQQAVVRNIGLDPTRHTFNQALSQLARQRSLLIFDNFETAWEPDVEQVEGCLQELLSVPTVSIIVGLRGGDVPRRPRWSRRPVRVKALDEASSRKLFISIADKISSKDKVLNDLLDALGGVPLAIELVAQRVSPQESLDDLRREWKSRGIALASHPNASPGRLTSVDRSIDLSLQSPRLREEGRTLFRVLGELPVGIAAEDRIELFKNKSSEAARQLLGVGLAFERNKRIDLLPPIRDFARRQHVPKKKVCIDWVGHFLALASDMGPQLGWRRGSEAAARLIPESPNIEAAFDVKSSSRDFADAIKAVFGYTEFLRFTGVGNIDPIRRLAKACNRAGNSAGEAICALNIGNVEAHRSRYDLAEMNYRRALELFKDTHNLEGEAKCTWRLGDVFISRWDHSEARKLFLDSLRLHQIIGDERGSATCRYELGNIALYSSQFDVAKQAYEEALLIYQRHADELHIANCIWRLGDVAMGQGRLDNAEQQFKEASALFIRVGDARGEANCLQRSGDIALKRKKLSAATQLYLKALTIYQEVASAFGQANCLRSLGHIARDRKKAKQAYGRYLEALSLYQSIPNPFGVGNIHRQLAEMTRGKERKRHLEEARKAWLSIERFDLVDSIAHVDRF